MCNIKKAFSRAFTPPGTGAMEAAQKTLIETTQNEANRALAAQQQALDQAQAASDSASENTRLASEQRLRKLVAAGSFGAAFGKAPAAPAPVGFRSLYGG